MKHTNSRFVVARLVLVVLTLAITVFSFASCDSLPPELQGLLGGNPNANCEHEYDNECDFRCNKCDAALIGIPTHNYDNACDTDCNICGATRTTKHAYENGICSVCGATDESIYACEHANVQDCVCKDCNASVHDVEYVPARSSTPIGELVHGLICDIYICYECEQAAYDAEFKNIISDQEEWESIYVYPLDHNYLDGICDVCGESRPDISGDNGDGGKLDPVPCKHPLVENCICMDCNASVHDVEYVPARSSTPIGELVHGLICDIYICYECEEAAYDVEFKNIISDQEEWESIYVYPLDHNYVDGICDVCGESRPDISEAKGDDGI